MINRSKVVIRRVCVYVREHGSSVQEEYQVWGFWGLGGLGWVVGGGGGVWWGGLR